MAYSHRYSDTAVKQFAALDAPLQKRIREFLTEACTLADPSVRFERLHGNLAGLWKHREGHLRMIADIDRGRVRILVLKIGRRDDVYGVNKAELKRFERDRD